MRSLSIFDPAFVGRLNGISVSINPESYFYYEANTGPNPSRTSSNITGSAIGGTASYTYSWSRTAGDNTINVNSPSSAVTSFTKTGDIGGGGIFNATMLLTVADSSSLTGYSIPVSISFELYPSTPP